MAQKRSPKTFNGMVTGPVLSDLALKTVSTPARATTRPAAGSTKGAAGKTAGSSAESSSGEVEVEARLPLIEAIKTLGGPEVLLAATDLELVATKFPKGDKKTPSSENRFVQGLQGRLTLTAPPDPKSKTPVPVKLAKGDLFRIRWDFVPGKGDTDETGTDEATGEPGIPAKGLHVNAEYGIGTGNACKSKIAYTPPGGHVFDPPNSRNPTQFDQIVRDYSNFLEYDSKPNTLQHVFTVEERLHSDLFAHPKTEPSPARGGRPAAQAKSQIHEDAARRLAERWAMMVRDQAQRELKEPNQLTGPGKGAAASSAVRK